MPESIVETFNLPVNSNTGRTDAYFFVSINYFDLYAI